MNLIKNLEGLRTGNELFLIELHEESTILLGVHLYLFLLDTWFKNIKNILQNLTGEAHLCLPNNEVMKASLGTMVLNLCLEFCGIIYLEYFWSRILVIIYLNINGV